MRAGQAAMEYLFVVGFAFMLLIPIIALFYTQSGTIEDEVIASQANKALEEIVAAADQVYFLGEPSKQTLSVRFPERINSVEINGSRITINYQSAAGENRVAKTADANLTGSIGSYSGVHIITVSATTNGVRLSE